jgi:hypothetical protein
VFIKNSTEKPQQFHLDIIFPGGQWGANLKTLAPGQTFKLDVREIRDSQVKGSEGNTISQDATSGHVYWSAFGTSEKVLIGRAQTVDLAHGMVSTYECQVCPCPSSFANARMMPSSVIGYPGYTELLHTEQQNRNCLGTLGSWFTPSGVTFSSTNPSVATIDSGGLMTAIDYGSTTLYGSWTGTVYYTPDGRSCATTYVNPSPGASCDVQCQVPSGENTSAGGWDLSGTRQNWFMILLPNTGPWVGRRIYEQGEFGPPFPGDTCWFQGSDFPPFDSPSNTPDQFWTVNAARQWGPDTIGYGSTRVTYYRQQGKAPCGTRFTQFMFIDCGAEKRQYARWTLGADIGTTTVSSIRAGQTETRTWP